MFRWFLGLFTKKTVRSEIPVLVKFWQEDGVWNGSAHDLPIAVFGNSLKEAQDNLGDAIISHLNALEKLGKIDAVVNDLQRLVQERISREEMAHGELFCTVTAESIGRGFEVMA